MPNVSGAHAAPKSPDNDTGSSGEVAAADEVGPIANKTDDATAGEGMERDQLYIIPTFLAAIIFILNIFVAVRYWHLLWPSRDAGTVPLAFIVTSMLIGLFIIVCAIVLGRSRDGESTKGRFAKWVVAPFILALLAFAGTLSAAGIAEPTTPELEVQTPCIKLYQEALNIKKENPNFRMPSTEPDNLRCRINAVLAR